MENKNVAFQFESYKFTKASLDFNIPKGAELDISFNPRGKFDKKKKLFLLFFTTNIRYKEEDVVSVDCEALFIFNDEITFEEIPDYFYPNSLAIVFPYVRSFVSTLSLQANVNPIVLPTINLMGLKDELKERTIVKD